MTELDSWTTAAVGSRGSAASCSHLKGYVTRQAGRADRHPHETVMSQNDQSAIREQQLQVLDVNVVDVLSHLEALLRQSHSIQRELLELRSEAPPPFKAAADSVIAVLTGHADRMGREWSMLGEIISDLQTGIHRLSGHAVLERRSGSDRRGR